TVCGNMPTLYSGAVAYPRIAGFNQLLQIEVRQDLFGKMRACADDTRIDQLVDSVSACAMCAVRPRRAATAAVVMALENATPSARPWLFTTIPARPTMHAPL